MGVPGTGTWPKEPRCQSARWTADHAAWTSPFFWSRATIRARCGPRSRASSPPGSRRATEVVIVDDASGPEVGALLARLDGDVVVRRSPAPIGRAAPRSRSPPPRRAPTSASRSRPGPAPLPDSSSRCWPPSAPARRSRCPCWRPAAASSPATASTEDGSLWPLPLERAAEAAAPALDCLAAPRSFFLDLPPFSALFGHYEPTLAAHAGGLVVVAGGARRAGPPSARPPA